MNGSLRVFLSHTSELRQYPLDRSFVAAAEHAVTRAEGTVLDMEYFTAREERPADYCRQEMIRADVYVGIIGFLYGSRLDHEPTLSFTEMEFHIAAELGLPRLVFLLDENATLPLPQKYLSDLVNGNRQQAFRAMLLQAKLTAHHVKSPDQLEMLLFHALTQLWQPPADHGVQPVSGVAVRVAPRPPFLAGREALMTELDERLASSRGQAPAVLALTGLGGAGKTSVALAYAHRHLPEFGIVWQFAAEEPAALAAGFSELALQLSGRDAPSGGDPVALVHTALAKRKDWLLLFDNAGSPAAVQRMLPPAGGGQVLITSQNPHWPKQVVLEVPVLERPAAASFLMSRTGAGAQEAEAANELAYELGRLPLALEQASAYMLASGRGIGEYLGLFRNRRPELLDRGDPAGYDKRVATTWALAYAELGDSSPVAGLLRLAACCAAESIPLHLLLRQRPGLSAELDARVAPLLVPLLDDALAGDEAVAGLRSYSLISEPRKGFISVHRLVQAITLAQLPDDLEAAWRKAAAAVIEAAIPADTDRPEAWPTCAALLPHAQVALAYDSDGMTRIASYLSESGNYTAARDLQLNITRAREERYGPLNPLTLLARASLAHFTAKAGDAAAACDQLSALLPSCERILGADHRQTLAVRHQLARRTGHAGDAAASRDQLAALLPSYEAQFGPTHLQTLTIRHQLARRTGQAGDAAAARDQLAALLPRCAQALGPSHPHTLTIRYSLARWIGDAGDMASARDQLAAVLPIREQVSGREHPWTLSIRARLACYTGDAGDPAAARDQLAALLHSYQRVLGPDHPQTLGKRRLLARFTAEAGDPAAARDQLTALLPVSERVCGLAHPDTLLVREALARWAQDDSAAS